MDRPLSLPRRAAWLLGGLAFGLCLLETGLRLVLPDPSRLQGGRIVLPRGRVYRFENAGLRGCDPVIVHHKNALGFRGPPPPSPFEDSLTIVAVGGSTTECFYLSDGRSWPELVALRLRPRFPNVWVNNAGLDGHSTFGHAVLVRDVLAALKPKVALFLVGVNDVGRDDLNWFERRMNGASEPFGRGLQWAESRSRTAALLLNLARYWNARRRGLLHADVEPRALRVLAVPAGERARLLHEHETKYIPGYARRLDDLILLCRRAGIFPVLLTQPALYGPGRDPETGVDLGAVEVEPGEDGALAWKILELYNAQTRAAAERLNVPLIDLGRRLPKTSRYFYDFHHFTNDGSAAAASIVAEGLEPILAAGQYRGSR